MSKPRYVHFRTSWPILGLSLLCFVFTSSCRNRSGSADAVSETGKDNSMAVMIEDFHRLSYLAGAIACAAEFVGCGAKKLALSSPLTAEELAALLEPARIEAEKNEIPYYVEKDLLVTKLFSPDIARGKTVILFAYDRDILSEYHTLKAFKAQAEAGGRLAEVEDDIARRFGRLLSYNAKAVQRLLAESNREEE